MRVREGGISQTPQREVHSAAITHITKGLLTDLRTADKGRCVW